MPFPVHHDSDGQDMEEYQHCFPLRPHSGLWSPLSSSLEARRGSIASTLASTSSTSTGHMSESDPLTPVNEDGYVEVMPYFSHDYHSSHPTYTIPGEQEHVPYMCESWEEASLPNTNEFTSGPFDLSLCDSRDKDLHQIPNMGIPEMDATVMVDHSMVMDAMPESSSWNGNPSIGQTNTAQLLDGQVAEQQPQILDQDVSDGTFEWMWYPRFTSHTVTEPNHIGSSWTHVQLESSPIIVSNPLDDSAFPQTPQEVSCKIETSPMLKQEPQDDVEAGPYYVESTGAKKVNRRRSTKIDSRKVHATRLSRRSKRRRTPSSMGYLTPNHVFQTGLYCDENSNRQPQSSPTIDFVYDPNIPTSRYICSFPQCHKNYRRIEHMKRHFVTHKDERPYQCIICPKEKRFGRKDNYKEHYYTHVLKPGSNQHQRNPRLPLEILEAKLRESNELDDAEKVIEHVRGKLNKESVKQGLK